MFGGIMKRVVIMLMSATVCVAGIKLAFDPDLSYINYAKERIEELTGSFLKSPSVTTAVTTAVTSEATPEGTPTVTQAETTIADEPHSVDNSPAVVEGFGTLIDEPQEQDADDADSVDIGDEYDFDEKIYPYYALLGESQKEVYCQVYANALALNTSSFTLCSSVTESELSDIVCSIYCDHPELFWVETAYSYTYTASGKAVSLKLSYYIKDDEISETKAKLDAVVNEIVAVASEYDAEIEQELYVHDAIDAIAAYDINSEMNQSAYSALVEGKTVCAGYARTFQYVMQRLGYAVYYCTGSSDGQDHAWNIIEIEGEFYNVDLTWDDAVSEAYGKNVYPYFNLTDDAISSDHTRSGLSLSLPKCTSTDMAYTTVYGNTIAIDDIMISSGNHASGEMVINPSAPDMTDWTVSAPQFGGNVGGQNQSSCANDNRSKP